MVVISGFEPEDVGSSPTPRTNEYHNDVNYLKTVIVNFRRIHSNRYKIDINMFMSNKQIIPFRERTFYQVLEIAQLNRHLSDDELQKVLETELNLSENVSLLYMESLHDFFSRGVF